MRVVRYSEVQRMLQPHGVLIISNADEMERLEKSPQMILGNVLLSFCDGLVNLTSQNMLYYSVEQA